MIFTRSDSLGEDIIKIWQETILSPIQRRAYHSSSYYQKNLYIYGGYDCNVGILADFIKISISEDKKWQKIQKKNNPGLRHSHTCVQYKQKMFIFGGKISCVTNTNLLHAYSFKQQSWQLIKHKGTIPQEIDSHSADLYANNMIVYGGFNKQKYCSKIQSLNLDSFQWSVIFDCMESKVANFPPLRTNCTVNVYNQGLYIFGGTNMEEKFNDLWCFNLLKNNFTQIKYDFIQQKRSGHSSILYGNSLIIFGGTTGVALERNDLILYNIQKNEWNVIWKDTKEQFTLYDTFLKNINSSKKQNKNVKKSQVQQESVNESTLHNQKKYRKQLKEVSYYNNLYEKQIQITSKIKKEYILNKSLFSNYYDRDQLNKSLRNSKFKREDTVENYKLRKQKEGPKARDGHSCCLIDNNIMVIFGGDEYMVTFNSLIKIDINANISQQLRVQELQRNLFERKQSKSKKRVSSRKSLRQITVTSSHKKIG